MRLSSFFVLLVSRKLTSEASPLWLTCLHCFIPLDVFGNVKESPNCWTKTYNFKLKSHIFIIQRHVVKNRKGLKLAQNPSEEWNLSFSQNSKKTSFFFLRKRIGESNFCEIKNRKGLKLAQNPSEERNLSFSQNSKNTFFFSSGNGSGNRISPELRCERGVKLPKILPTHSLLYIKLIYMNKNEIFCTSPIFSKILEKKDHG